MRLISMIEPLNEFGATYVRLGSRGKHYKNNNLINMVDNFWKRRLGHQSIGWRVLFCSLSGLVLVACGERNTPEIVEQAIRPAKVVRVTSSDMSARRVYVGRVEASNSIDLSFEVPGPLSNFPVLEGQTLRKGELIAQLDPTDYELAVEESELQLKLALQDYQRKSDMLRKGGIAKSLVDDSLAYAQLQRVRLKKAREALSDTIMKAPFDAYVSRRYVDNYVKTRVGDKIVRLNDLHELLVVVSIPEQMLSTVIGNDQVSLFAIFDFIPGQMFPLTYKENRGDANSIGQTYEVSLSMPRPDSWEILPGMTAAVLVHQADRPDQQLKYFLPINALVTDTDKRMYVWVYDENTQEVEKRYVQVDRPDPKGVYVESGLEKGELVVSSGADQLREGMKIRLLNEDTD